MHKLACDPKMRIVTNSTTPPNPTTDKNLHWPVLPPMTLCGGPVAAGYSAAPVSLDWESYPAPDLTPTEQPEKTQRGRLIVQRSQFNQRVSDDLMQWYAELREIQCWMRSGTS